MDQCQNCGVKLNTDDLEENHHGCRDHDHGKNTICPSCRWCAACDEKEHQCEVCDEFFVGEPITSEETGKRQFCSDDCLFEAREDKRIAEIEAKREYELYGDDLDSWFR